jgi:hypothetical protein
MSSFRGPGPRFWWWASPLNGTNDGVTVFQGYSGV